MVKIYLIIIQKIAKIILFLFLSRLPVLGKSFNLWIFDLTPSFIVSV